MNVKVFCNNSTNGGGFADGNGVPASQVPVGSPVYNPGTGQTGTSDGYGGVHVNK
jgi:putative alpha-1,2-mannosidase